MSNFKSDMSDDEDKKPAAVNKKVYTNKARDAYKDRGIGYK